MKKNLLFGVDERLKEKAKRLAREEKSYFMEFNESLYQNGYKLHCLAKNKGIKVDDVLYYLETCINAGQIQKAIQENQ